MLVGWVSDGIPLTPTSITPPLKVSAPGLGYLAIGKPAWAQLVEPVIMPSLALAVTASLALLPVPSSSFHRLTSPLDSVDAGAVSGGRTAVSRGSGMASAPPLPPRD